MGGWELISLVSRSQSLGEHFQRAYKFLMVLLSPSLLVSGIPLLPVFYKKGVVTQENVVRRLFISHHLVDGSLTKS